MVNRTTKRHGLAVLAVIAASGQAFAVPTTRMPPLCQGSELSLVLDESQQGPDGNAQSSIHLVVRNRSLTTCRIPGLPIVTFRDERSNGLPIERRIPPGMHPGPAVLPTVVPAGGVVDAALEWVPDDVLAGSHCYSPTTIEISIGEEAIAQPFHGRLCASPDLPAMFMQGWFRSSPIKETTR